MPGSATVIGCGATGIVTAGFLLDTGASVKLCDTAEQLQAFQDDCPDGTVNILWPDKEERLELTTLLSEDVAGACVGADLIVVCVSLFRQRVVSDILAECLTEGQTVIFSPGNMASLYLKKKLCQVGRKNILTADMSGNLWACRYLGAGKLMSAMHYAPKRVAACPAGETERVCRAVSAFFPVKGAANLLEAALNSPNVITHVSGTILNTAGIDAKKDRFRLFADGLSPTVIRYFKGLEEERNRVLEAAGLDIYSRSDAPLYERLMDIEGNSPLLIFSQLDGPSSTTHRYVSEDAACGVPLLISLAKEFGVAIPLTESFFTQACFINGMDYYHMGYTFRALGVEYIKENGINKWVL